METSVFLPVKGCVEAFLRLFKLSFSLGRLINPGRNHAIAENKEFLQVSMTESKGEMLDCMTPGRGKQLTTYLQVRCHGSSGSQWFLGKLPENKVLKELGSSLGSKFQESSHLHGRKTSDLLAAHYNEYWTLRFNINFLLMSSQPFPFPFPFAGIRIILINSTS